MLCDLATDGRFANVRGQLAALAAMMGELLDEIEDFSDTLYADHLRDNDARMRLVGGPITGRSIPGFARLRSILGKSIRDIGYQSNFGKYPIRACLQNESIRLLDGSHRIAVLLFLRRQALVDLE